MVIRGQISNGVVQIDGQVPLPDGTRVLVVPESGSISDPSKPAGMGHRVQVPLVPSQNPGTVVFDSQRIAEILDDRDSP